VAGQSAEDAITLVLIRDADRDGIADAQDDCLEVPNRDQLDANGDGYGDACDADYDDDGVVGGSDFNTFRRAFGSEKGYPGFEPACDHDGSWSIDFGDLAVLRRSLGRPPGPSGLACAGSPPCGAAAE
jgi:hypothetical protein